MKEGEATQGVWLPIALSDILIWLMASVRIQLDEKARRMIKIPNRSDVLGWWCLPMMAKAVSVDERRFEEAERAKRKSKMADDLMELAKRMGAKVTVNGK